MTFKIVEWLNARKDIPSESDLLEPIIPRPVINTDKELSQKRTPKNKV